VSWAVYLNRHELRSCHPSVQHTPWFCFTKVQISECRILPWPIAFRPEMSTAAQSAGERSCSAARTSSDGQGQTAPAANVMESPLSVPCTDERDASASESRSPSPGARVSVMGDSTAMSDFIQDVGDEGLDYSAVYAYATSLAAGPILCWFIRCHTFMASMHVSRSTT
jgi:hypothetical protein